MTTPSVASGASVTSVDATTKEDNPAVKIASKVQPLSVMIPPNREDSMSPYPPDFTELSSPEGERYLKRACTKKGFTFKPETKSE